MEWLVLIAVLPYFLLLLKICSDLRKIKRYSPSKNQPVRLSVVIACRNEEADLPFLLEDLKEQHLQPQNYCLVLVDDNSNDNTYNIISGFRIENSLTGPVLLRNSGTGKKAAISSGIAASPYEMIVTTDADCRVGPGWLETISQFCSDSRPDMIISPVALSAGTGFFSGFQQIEFLSLQGITAGAAYGKNPVMCNGANLAFRKEAFLRNEKNLRRDHESGDDIFLLHSLKKEGARIMWLESPEATVIASSAKSIGSFLGQRKRWISKSRSYKDLHTVTLGIVTFITILTLVLTLVAGFFNPAYWLVYLTVFLIKSIPDFLILHNTASRYNRKHLLKWFLPSQIVYPFYVLAVLMYPVKTWKK